MVTSLFILAPSGAAASYHNSRLPVARKQSRFATPGTYSIFSFAMAGAGASFAQSQPTQDQAQEELQARKNQNIAEAARQERARKQTQQKKSRHVYTAEDLKREHILSAQDRAELEARKRQQPALPARVRPSPVLSGKLAMVTVKPGDSLWKFAASRLGDGRRWQELLTLNPGLRNPDALEVGSRIVVPACFAPPLAPRKYAVRHGDTLWTIAQTQLGPGTAWSCIAQANPELQDANRIDEGRALLLPAACWP